MNNREIVCPNCGATKTIMTKSGIVFHDPFGVVNEEKIIISPFQIVGQYPCNCCFEVMCQVCEFISHEDKFMT
jgi:hypothetical protein